MMPKALSSQNIPHFDPVLCCIMSLGDCATTKLYIDIVGLQLLKDNLSA